MDNISGTGHWMIRDHFNKTFYLSTTRKRAGLTSLLLMMLSSLTMPGFADFAK